VVSHADFLPLVPDVIGKFGLWPYGEPEPVSGGTLNWNYKVRTDGGTYFLRRYRDNLETPRIRGEHALVRWVSEHGVPAPLPEATDAEETVITMGGGRWALYGWCDGEVRTRGTLTDSQTRTLGALHGFTQSVLAGYPMEAPPTMTMSWDKAASIALLRRISDVASSRQTESWILEGLATQLVMLEALDVLTPEAFASLPIQMLHGDFHDQQVIWDGENVAALVDWEVWRTDPRAWEVVRSMAFSRVLETPQLEPYLEGYRQFVRLGEAECRLALRMWWQSRLVGVWAWAAYFLEGNERVAEFFPEMISALQRQRDDSWRQGIEERFVRAALG